MTLFTAQVISILFHPLILSFITPIILILFYPREVPYSVLWVLYPLFFICVVCIFTLLGVKAKLFSDFDVTKRSERGPLYVFVIILSVIYIAFLFIFNGPKSLMILGGGILAGAVIFDLINRRLKASIHVGVVSAFMSSLALLFGGIFFVFPIFIPIVAWSRIHMRKHTLSESIMGGLIGVGLTIIIFLVIQYILFFYA